MAGNFFLCRTQSPILLLFYSLLEWILIIFLLANALLSSIIVWFAAYFELPPPCVFCSRIDHLFYGGEAAVASALRRGLFCETHVGELSELGLRCSDLASEIQEFEQKDSVLGVTVDELKATKRVTRRHLGALYRELEEERSASAIAANQTMAMITRLQEEKAVMQMESIQYQRMMELVNELLTRRDKEKRQLEEEMSLLRRKLNFCC